MTSNPPSPSRDVLAVATPPLISSPSPPPSTQPTQPVSQSPTPPPTITSPHAPDTSSIDEKRCWICLTDESEELSHTRPRKRWVHPCQCKGGLKYVHEQCLLDWISEKSSNSSDPSLSTSTTNTVACPACGYVYQVMEPTDWILALQNIWENHVEANVLSPYVTLVTILSGFYVVSFTFGVYSFVTVLGESHPIVQKLFASPPSPSSSWGWRVYAGIPLIPYILVASRFRFLDPLMPFIPLMFFSGRHFSVYEPNAVINPNIEMGYWKTFAKLSPQFICCLLPWVRIVYGNVKAVGRVLFFDKHPSGQVQGERQQQEQQQQQPRRRNNNNNNNNNRWVSGWLGGLVRVEADLMPGRRGAGGNNTNNNNNNADQPAEQPIDNLENEDNEDDQEQEEQRILAPRPSLQRTLLGALFYPFFSSVTSTYVIPTLLHAPFIPASWRDYWFKDCDSFHRNVLSGCFIVVVKDVWNGTVGMRRRVQRRRRRIREVKEK